MAEVYLADDLALARAVAVKVLTGASLDGDDEAERFRTEARRVAAFTHPRIVAIYHAGEVAVNGRRVPYLVMPLLNESLREVLLRARRLPSADAVSVALQVAEGLQAAHRRGLVHRDVKPENILLDAEGQALLADFGIAREVEHEREPHHGTTPTPVGRVLGTPQYMAPEQLRGDPLDQRADIYSLGVVLYELLTGTLPFSGDSPYEYAVQVLQNAPTPLSDHVQGLPAALEMAVLTALARDPSERYPSMIEFAATLGGAITRQLASRDDVTPPTGVEMPGGIFASTAAVQRTRTGSLTSPAHTTVHTGPRKRSVLWLLTAVAVVLLMGSLLIAAVLQRAGGSLDLLTGTVPSFPGGLPTMQATGAPPPSPSGQGGSTVGVGQPGQTPLATSAPGTSPGAGASPTPSIAVTGTATVTVTATATATSAPGTALDIAPRPLVLSSAPSKTCSATQTITNTTNQTVGWAWQPPKVAGFHFQINGGPVVAWPSATTYTPAGGEAILVATSDCQTHGASTISVHDSMGGQYTFTMTVSA